MATESAKATDLVGLIERVIDVGGSRWAIVFADILAPALLNRDGAITGEAQTLIAASVRRVPPGQVARARLVIADFHVLALIQPDTRTCRLYTPGAAQEAFLLKLSGGAHLQAHVDAVRQHRASFTAIAEVTAPYDLVDLASPDTPVAGHDRAALVDAVRRQLEALARLMHIHRPSPVERLQNWFLQMATEDEPLLRQVLRFVALLTSLRFDRSRREVVRALRENVRLLRTQLAAHHRHRTRAR